jgi:hypothetical protein
VGTWRQDVTGEADADGGRATPGVLGLPDAVTAGLFDLDGGRDTGEADALREHGADIVVSDLAELLDAPGGKAAR